MLHDGVMVPTGGCMLKTSNAKGTEEAPINTGDGTNAISSTCEMKEGDI